MQSGILTVIGAGSWGTALAIQGSTEGRPVILTGRPSASLKTIQSTHRNDRYLPGISLPETLSVITHIEQAIQPAQDLLICVPSHAFRETLEWIKPHIQSHQRLCWATKGFELNSGLLPHQVAHDVIGDHDTAVLSGPTFATEVAKGLPTALTVASTHPLYAEHLATRLSSSRFRIYTSNDVIGVEIGGAVKNVIAIAAGISDGLGLGANSRTALITRGLSEMVRLGSALDAKPTTFMGLTGLGDLMLTASDNQSRNRRFGLLLAKHHNVEQALIAIDQVVEGVRAAECVHQVATLLNVEMPICECVYQILKQRLPLNEAVDRLMNRSLKTES